MPLRASAHRAVVGQEMDIVLAADVSADGRLIALGGPTKVAKVYSVADGKLAYQITKHTDWITAVEFSPRSFLGLSAMNIRPIFCVGFGPPAPTVELT